MRKIEGAIRFVPPTSYRFGRTFMPPYQTDRFYMFLRGNETAAIPSDDQEVSSEPITKTETTQDLPETTLPPVSTMDRDIYRLQQAGFSPTDIIRTRLPAFYGVSRGVVLNRIFQVQKMEIIFSEFQVAIGSLVSVLNQRAATLHNNQGEPTMTITSTSEESGTSDIDLRAA